MDAMLMNAFGQAGAYAAVAFAAIGSGLGVGAACTAAVGAWKKCYAGNRTAPLQLAIFAGAPLTQTIYGMILMFLINGKLKDAAMVGYWPLFLMIGVGGGIAMGISAWKQGVAGAGACDAFAETGKGFTNYLMALGIVETVAIFSMAFAIILIGLIK